MQQGTAEELYSQLTKEVPKRHLQLIQLTPVSSVPHVPMSLGLIYTFTWQVQCADLLKIVENLPGRDIKARNDRACLTTYLQAAVKKPASFGDSLAEFEMRLRAALNQGTVVRVTTNSVAHDLLLTTLAQPTIKQLKSKNFRLSKRGVGASSASTASGSHSLGAGPELSRRAAAIYNVDREHWQELRSWRRVSGGC